MWPQPIEELSIKRNWACLPMYLETSQLFLVILSWQFPVSCKTTFPSTISSARSNPMSQPPPIRNVKEFPPITKLGDVSEPVGPSPWSLPAGWEGLGRSSKPPIHQSPWWLDGCPLFLAVGLSPYVGWLSNTVPVRLHPDKPFSK